MSKKPMTWMDVIKEQLAKMRKEGKSPSIGDVTPAAKKEWAEIKSGKHPLYSQGSSKGRSKGKQSKGKQSKGKQSNGKQSKNKTQKMSKASSSQMSMDHQYRIEQMLKKVHLCKKCESKIHKHMKTMKMQKGGDCGCSQSGGGSSCSSCQEGGKGKGRRTMKVKKGKKGMKGGYVSIVGTDGLENGTEETDGTQEKVVVNEGEDV
jgi:hypothetical protein